MQKDIEEKVLAFSKQYNLFKTGKRVLLAVSGGADSVALAQILINAGRTGNNFHIAHINHQLRGKKADEDENFVKSLAQKYDLPVTIERIDVRKYAKENKLSIETAGRELRLGKLAQTAKKNNCESIATAHHKNDNAETIIHRILRGTSFKGLAGIRPKMELNDITFIRPLLCLDRSEIEDYLVSGNINWQTDHTNMDCRFTRNRIRHKLLPMLQSQSKDNLIESLFVLSQKYLAFSERIESLAKAALQNCMMNKSQDAVSIDIEKFDNYSALLKVEIIQLALQQCGTGLQKMTSEHYEKTINFTANGQTGKTLQMPGKVIFKKEQNSFSLSCCQSVVQKLEPVKLEIPSVVCFGNFIIEAQKLSSDSIDIENIGKNKDDYIEWFDAERVKPPLIVRQRQTGDKFKPFGLDSYKKIGKFLTSAKIESSQRKKAFLVCDSEKVLWLVPARRSNEAVVNCKSKMLLQIKITKK
ncbi:MAG: tRNA lysidine(34) synthetase TilS [Sedimentisphaerales bacterium]|nr:tRNA lysidine(34) synthetase TilS [Sedimentisphaerales bacterium]